MILKRLLIICTLPLLLPGCSEFYGSQPPAPVYGSQPKPVKPNSNAQKKSRSNSAYSKEVFKVQPLKEYSVIKPEALPSPELQHVDSAPIAPVAPKMEEMAPTTPAATAITHESVAAPAPTATITPVQPPQPSVTPGLTAFEPMEATAALSPAVGALVLAANQNSRSGDLELAAASLERAIRIEPRNANLFYKLALLRLKQEKPRLAEDLAKKSALLAASDNKLKKHCWLLIAHVREKQQNFAGAKEARAKAENF